MGGDIYADGHGALAAAGENARDEAIRREGAAKAPRGKRAQARRKR